MARRSFLERFADAAIEAAKRALDAAVEALDAVVETAPGPELPSVQPPQRLPGRRPSAPSPAGGRSRLTRTGRLEDRVAELIGLVETQNVAIERQNAEIERLRAAEAQRQRLSEREERARTRQESAEERAEARLTQYPRRTDGRAGRLAWGEENVRLQTSDYNIIKEKYNELLRAGVPVKLLAIVQTGPNTWILIVTQTEPI